MNHQQSWHHSYLIYWNGRQQRKQTGLASVATSVQMPIQAYRESLWAKRDGENTWRVEDINVEPEQP